MEARVYSVSAFLSYKESFSSEVCLLVAESPDEAVGKMVRQLNEKSPNSSVYRIETHDMTDHQETWVVANLVRCGNDITLSMRGVKADNQEQALTQARVNIYRDQRYKNPKVIHQSSVYYLG